MKFCTLWVNACACCRDVYAAGRPSKANLNVLQSRVISRLEDAHAKLKRYLQVSTGDLPNVVLNIGNFIKNDVNKHTVTTAQY